MPRLNSEKQNNHSLNMSSSILKSRILVAPTRKAGFIFPNRNVSPLHLNHEDPNDTLTLNLVICNPKVIRG